MHYEAVRPLQIFDGVAEVSQAEALPNGIRPRLRLSLIGRMDFTAGQRSALPLGRKTRALLAILALAAPHAVSRTRLAELLWSRRLEEQARASLRQEIHRLQETLKAAGANVLTVARDHLSLCLDTVRLDVAEVARATAAEPEPLALLQDELLADFDGLDPAFDQWLAAERERLRDRGRAVAEALLAAQVTPEAVIPAARRLLHVDRAHEGAWRAIMRAHAERGERAAAIQAYERCRATLAQVMDTAPAPETQRLLAGIRAGSISPGTAGAQAAEPARAEGARPLPGVKLAVLPFGLIGTAEADAFLGTGLAEELAAALVRFGWMSLLSFAQFGTRDETALRHGFGLDFLLDGTVQRTARRSRVTIRLLDLRDGNKIAWVGSFNRQAGDMLTLQEEVAAEAAAQIEVEIRRLEGRRAALRPPEEKSAYTLVMRAMPLITRLQRDEFMLAGRLLDEAITAAPDSAAVHAWRAYWGVFCLAQGWAADRDAETAGTIAHAERAITLDPQNARALTIAGHVRARLDRQPRGALELHARALSLNPSLPAAWGLSAQTHIYIGDLDEAARRFAQLRRLAPNHPAGFFLEAGMVMLEIARRDYGEAIRIARRVCEPNPFFAPGLRHYAAALGHAGRVEEAATIRRRVLAIDPAFTVQAAVRNYSYEQAAEAVHYADGLRLAGLPET